MVKEVGIPVCCLPGGTAEAHGELPRTCNVLLSVGAFELEVEEACKLSCSITALGRWADLKLGFSHIVWPIAKFTSGFWTHGTAQACASVDYSLAYLPWSSCLCRISVSKLLED